VKKVVILLIAGSILAAGCSSQPLKTAPKPVNDAQEIQNDPNLSPAMKARLLRQVQSAGATQPGTRPGIPLTN